MVFLSYPVCARFVFREQTPDGTFPIDHNVALSPAISIFALSLNTRFKIFPDAFFGMTSRKISPPVNHL